MMKLICVKESRNIGDRLATYLTEVDIVKTVFKQMVAFYTGMYMKASVNKLKFISSLPAPDVAKVS